MNYKNELLTFEAPSQSLQQDKDSTLSVEEQVLLWAALMHHLKSIAGQKSFTSAAEIPCRG